MKNSSAISIVALVAAFATASCTMDGQDRLAAASSDARQCFFPSQISGFRNAGENRIYVDTGPSDVYLFETFGNCPDLDFAHRIGVEPVGGGTICSGLDVDLIVPTTLGPRKCPVRMIRKLTEAEMQAR